MAIGKVDCTVEKALSLRVFHYGVYYGDYPGTRTADSIIEFGEHMALSAVQMAKSYEDVMTLFLDTLTHQETIL